MAMPGTFYAYDGVVAVADLDGRDFSYQIVKDGVHYVSFDVATMPDEYYATPQGWDKHMIGDRHRELAKVQLLELAQRVYPELANAAKWPELWIEVPSMDVRHDTRYVKVPSAS